MKAILLHNPKVDQYSYGSEHPFVAGRSGMTVAMCRDRSLLEGPGETLYEPPPAAREDLKRFHEEGYLDVLEQASKGHVTPDWLTYGLGSPECPVFNGLWDYCLMVAGGTIEAARLLAAREADRVFHPAGGLHHAFPARAEGFCYVNDVVLSIMALREKGLRVAVVDIDAHHGNGTQFAFYSDPDVLTISVHESGKTLYPWGGFENELGEGAGEGFNINVPLPMGVFDEAYKKVMDSVVLPAVTGFDPDMLLTEVGGDVLSGDPLTNLSLTNNGIVSALESLDILDVPWLVVGGGGYNVQATVKAWTRTWSVVSRQPLEDPYAGLIGGMMTGLADVEGGDLRDRLHYTPPELQQQVYAELDPVLAFLDPHVEKLSVMRSRNGCRQQRGK